AGELSLAAPLTVRATIDWQDAAWPAFAFAASPAGRLELDGGLEALDFAATGSVQLHGVPAELQARGTANRAALELDALSLATPHGSLDAVGTFTFDTGRWEAAVDARNL